MTKKQISEAAKEHAKSVLGEKQSIENKLAAKSIVADFTTGANYILSAILPAKSMKSEEASTDKVNNVCIKILSLTDKDIASTEEMIRRQNEYINPLRPTKQGKFNELGDHNSKIIAALKSLRNLIAAGDPNA